MQGLSGRAGACSQARPTCDPTFLPGLEQNCISLTHPPRPQRGSGLTNCIPFGVGTPPTTETWPCDHLTRVMGIPPPPASSQEAGRQRGLRGQP